MTSILDILFLDILREYFISIYNKCEKLFFIIFRDYCNNNVVNLSFLLNCVLILKCQRILQFQIAKSKEFKI